MSGKSLQDRIGIFVAVPNRFARDSHISNSAFRLFTYLRSFVNNSESIDKAYPSYQTIHRDTGMHFKTISRACRELEHLGWLERHHRYGASTVYILKYPDESTATNSSSAQDAVLLQEEAQSFAKDEHSPATSRRETRTSPQEQIQKGVVSTVSDPGSSNHDLEDRILDLLHREGVHRNKRTAALAHRLSTFANWEHVLSETCAKYHGKPGLLITSLENVEPGDLITSVTTDSEYEVVYE